MSEQDAKVPEEFSEIIMSEAQHFQAPEPQKDKDLEGGNDATQMRPSNGGQPLRAQSVGGIEAGSFKDHMDYRHRKHFTQSRRAYSSQSNFVNGDMAGSLQKRNMSRTHIFRQTRRHSLDAAMEEASRSSQANSFKSTLSELQDLNSYSDQSGMSLGQLVAEHRAAPQTQQQSDATALEKFLEEQYVFAALHGGSELDDRLDAVRSSEKQYDGDDLSLLFSSPILPLLRKRSAQAVMLLIALAMGALLVGAARSLAHPFTRGSEFRFAASELRDGSEAAGPHIGNVTLTLDGCPLVAAEMRQWTEGRFLRLAFPRPVTINGLVLTTHPDLPPDKDPLHFDLEVRGSGGEWELVGQRAWRQGVWLGLMRLRASQQLPRERGADTAVPLEPGPGWAIGNVGMRVVLSVGLAGVCGLAGAGRFLLAKQLLAGVAAAAAALSVAAAALMQGSEGLEESALWWLKAAYLTVLAASLLRPSLEVLFVPALSACGLLELLAVLLDMALHAALTRLHARLDAYVALGLLGVGVGIIVRRRQTMKQLQLSLGDDMAAYDAVWAEMQAEPGQQEALEELQRLVRQSGKQATLAHSPLVQHRVGNKDPAEQELGPGGGQGDSVMVALRRSLSWRRHEGGSVVHSLDQVYAQAAPAHFILRRKLGEWALRSKALVRLRPRPALAPARPRARRWSMGSQQPEEAVVVEREYARYSAVSGRAEMEARVGWEGLKQPRRAIAKALQLYQGDVSRVVDVCREALYFESVAALCMCLRTLLCDDQLAVLRLKNTLDPAWPSELCAGFRGVKVNLRFRHDLARSLGCHGHCLELLLIPRPFDALQSPAAHQRFLHLRAVRDASALQAAPLHVLSALLHCLRPRHASLAPRNRIPRIPSVSAGSASTGRASSASEAAVARAATSPSSPANKLASASVCYAADSSSRLSGGSGGASWTRLGGGVFASPPAPDRNPPAHSVPAADSAPPAPGPAPALAMPPAPAAAELPPPSADGGLLWAREAAAGGRRHSSAAAPPDRPKAQSERAGLQRLGRSVSHGRERSGWLGLGSSRKLVGPWDGLLDMLRGGRRKSGREYQDYSWTATAPSTREEETAEMMRRELVRRATREHSQLDREKESIADAMEAAHAVSVFTTSIPIAAALCKRWFRWLLSGVSLLFLYFAFTEVSLAFSLASYDFPLVRFSPLLLPPAAPEPEPLAPSSEPLLAEFGVLQGTCRRSLAVLRNDGAAFTIGAPAPGARRQSGVIASEAFADPDGMLALPAEEGAGGGVWYSGFWLVLREPLAEGSSVGFRVEGSRDGAGWEELATPRGFLTQSNQRLWEQRAVEAGVERVDLDARVGWEVVMRSAGINLSTAGGCVGAVYSAAVHRQRYGKWFLVASLSIGAIIYFVEAGVWQGRGRGREAGASLMYGVCTGATAGMLGLMERFIFAVFLVSGLLFLVARLIEDLLIVWYPYALIDSFPSVGTLLFMLGLWLLCWKHLVVRRSFRAIQHDNQAYAAAWQRVWGDPEERRALEALAAQCGAYLTQHHTRPAPRHAQRRRSWFVRRRSSADNAPSPAPSPDRDRARVGPSPAELIPRTPSFHLSSARARSPARTLPDAPGLQRSASVATATHTTAQMAAQAAAQVAAHAEAIRQSPVPSRGSFNSSRRGSLSSSGASEAVDARALELARAVDQSQAAARGGREPSMVGRMLKAPSVVLASLVGRGGEAEDALVRSLDQVYVQAAGLHARVVEKVQYWALLNHGHFPVHRADGEAEGAPTRFVAWEEVCGDEERAKTIKWASLKRKGRAIEKLVRSYQGDVSKLVDVCRQSVVFRRCADMQGCLTAILEDPDVSVCRIKNRMHDSYDARQTGGYRDLCLNLRMETREMRRLCIDQHVFEIQLVLMPFAQLKSDDGHARYVVFRNSRGE